MKTKYLFYLKKCKNYQNIKTKINKLSNCFDNNFPLSIKIEFIVNKLFAFKECSYCNCINS